MDLPIRKKGRIQTERLVLKPYGPQDLKPLTGLLTNPEITKTFLVPDFERPEQAEALARRVMGYSQAEDIHHLEYGIYLDGRLIGFVNDCGIEQDSIEIGYAIHPDFWGQGYASEALGSVLEQLREMGFRKVTAAFFEENAASRRVMEKCGMALTRRTHQEEYRGEMHICRYCEIVFP